MFHITLVSSALFALLARVPESEIHLKRSILAPAMLAAALAVAASVSAQPTPKPPSLDQLIMKVKEARKAKLEAAKAEAAAVTELKSALKDLGDLLKDLDIDGPVNPPAPSDPLALSLKTAYESDATTPDKKKHLMTLTELYKQASPLCDATHLTTVNELLMQIRTAADTLGVGGTNLLGVRKVIAEQATKVFGTDATKPLTPETRAAGKALFEKVHLALKAIGK